jgi:hypothetical protein
VTAYDIGEFISGKEPENVAAITYHLSLTGSLPLRFGDSCTSDGNKLFLYGNF